LRSWLFPFFVLSFVVIVTACAPYTRPADDAKSFDSARLCTYINTRALSRATPDYQRVLVMN
jgi:hypothetical protein